MVDPGWRCICVARQPLNMLALTLTTAATHRIVNRTLAAWTLVRRWHWLGNNWIFKERLHLRLAGLVQG